MKTRGLPGSEVSPSPFLNTVAVETWDTWFRWRADGQLRDVTIDDTWERVASALAAGPGRSAGYKRRLIDAFAAWQLLPDERLIATAGTLSPQWTAGNLRAVLNAASFVRAPGLRHASFDYALFEEVAALAVHALDDAIVTAAADWGEMARPRVGIIGLSDALALLGLDYDSEGGRGHAANIAQALAQGCLAATIVLARDRGARIRCGTEWIERARQRGYTPELIEGAQRHGLRQDQLTAITSQPRLAAFANGVADALDPLPGAYCAPADSYAASSCQRARSITDAAIHAPAARTCVVGQLRLRAAVQPWIDEHIRYPLAIERPPSAVEISNWNALARELDLAPLSWRFPSRNAHAANVTQADASVVGS